MNEVARHKLVCLSDPHGFLPEGLPSADAMIIAGDICPVYDHSISFQRLWLKTDFADWCNRQDVGNIVIVGGNHDFVFEADPSYGLFLQEFYIPNLMYLHNSSCYLELSDRSLLSVWGSPHSLNFGPWAFMGSEQELAENYAKIPDGVDIIVSHTPPFMHRDKCLDGQYAGSHSLVRAIDAVKPQLVVCGHIHEGYGVAYRGDAKIINASIMTAAYEPENLAMMYGLRG